MSSGAFGQFGGQAIQGTRERMFTLVEYVHQFLPNQACVGAIPSIGVGGKPLPGIGRFPEQGDWMLLRGSPSQRPPTGYRFNSVLKEGWSGRPERKICEFSREKVYFDRCQARAVAVLVLPEHSCFGPANQGFFVHIDPRYFETPEAEIFVTRNRAVGFTYIKDVYRHFHCFRLW